MADDVAKFTRFFGGNGSYQFHPYLNAGTQTALESGDYLAHHSGLELWSGHQQDTGFFTLLLHHLERLHTVQVAQNVDQRQAVHDGAVGGDHKVGTAALDFFQHW